MKPSDENLNISDSQTLNSLCTLSLPSEPPDVRNWFLSYVYESPEFDTNEKVVDSLPLDHGCSEGTEGFAKDKGSKKNLFASREISKPQELDFSENEKSHQLVFEDNSHRDLSDVLDSFSSPSLLSAPPSVQNWFSSYLYESPGLSASSIYEGSAFEKNECKDYSLVEDSNTKKGACLVESGSVRTNFKLFDEEMTSSNESRYLEKHYEQGMQSPNEDTKKSDGFGKVEENKREKEENMFGFRKRPELCVGDQRQQVMIDINKGSCNFSKPKELTVVSVSRTSATRLPEMCGSRYIGESSTVENSPGVRRSSDGILIGGKINSNDFGEPKISLGDNDVRVLSPNKDNIEDKGTNCWPREINDCYKKPSDKSIGNDMLQNLGNSLKDVGELNLDVDGILCRAGVNYSTKTNFTTEEINATSGNCYKNKIYMVGAEIQPTPDLSQSKNKLESGHSSKSSCDSLRECPDDGFVKTKKSRRLFKESDENGKDKQERSLSKEKSMVSLNGEKDVDKRKVLAETTNLTSPNVIEFTGKWRCPQKSKPHLGPPLKQLRLDYWVHRI